MVIHPTALLIKESLRPLILKGWVVEIDYTFQHTFSLEGNTDANVIFAVTATLFCSNSVQYLGKSENIYEILDSVDDAKEVPFWCNKFIKAAQDSIKRDDC